jgi:DNA-binding SARP family transcriptional activator/TolB-like protein
MLELRTLGAVEIHDARGRLLAVSPKPLALLVYLAVARPRGPQQRDTLLALFYPELDQEHAHMAMRQLLRALRAAVGADVVQGDRQTVALAAERLTCDVNAFEVALAAGDPARVVALYWGAFLPGFFLSGCPEFDHWVDVERSRLERAYAGALEQLALEADAAGDGPRAVALWRQLAEVDPYATRVTVRLIAALEVAGNRAGALQVAERHAQRLRDELDAEPSPEIEALARRMREQPAPAVQVSQGSTRDRLARAVARRYRVDRVLGAGGMALVYLADDLKLGRPVALKVLRPELAAAIGHERFLSEIDIAAGLAHPNILPLHDAGEAEGLVYYVMPYVDGESLRARLAREGPLDVAEAVRIAREVAEALEHAHGKGIVHRDIKPANILLQANHAVVSDFGVALAIGNAVEDPALLGTTGTPAYMSPEQAAGSPNVDARSDLFSLGCVLHEMLTGSLPDPEPVPPGALVTKSSDPVPDNVEAALAKALAKSPADRFESAFAFAQALSDPHVADRGSGTRVGFRIPSRTIALVTVIAAAALGGWWLLNSLGGRTARIESLAVLPFENFAGDASQQYIVDGMHDAVIGEFFRIESVRVTARTSVMRYRDTDLTLTEIARELGVDAVIEGSVFPAGDSLRLQVNLVRTSPTERPLWSQTYNASVARALMVPGQVVRDVTERIELFVSPEVAAQLAAERQVPAAALDAFWQGEAHYRRSWEEEQLRLAIEMYDSATTLDPEFSLAYAKKSLAHAWMWWYWFDPTDERLALGRAAAERALSLDPELPEGRLALAGVLYWPFQSELDSGMQQYGIALQLQPNNSEIVKINANMLREQGRWQEAVEKLKLAAELDPGGSDIVYNAALIQLLRRDYADAERLNNRAITLNPNSGLMRFLQADIYLRLDGDANRALPVMQQALSQFGVVGAVFLPFRPIFPLLAAVDTTQTIRSGLLQLAPSGVRGALERPSDFYLLKADLHRLAGDTLLAVAYYDSARVMDESVLPMLEERGNHPVYLANIHARLGLAYAGLGDTVAAIREGETAVRLTPLSVSHVFGVDPLSALTRINIMVGRHDAAIDLLEQLLSVPSWDTPELVRIHPWYAALRGNPRFEALVQEN